MLTKARFVQWALSRCGAFVDIAHFDDACLYAPEYLAFMADQGQRELLPLVHTLLYLENALSAR